MQHTTIDRVRLRRAIEGAGVVVLVAPSGYGKSTFAGQLAEGGPSAWVASRHQMGEADLAGAIVSGLAQLSATARELPSGLASVAYLLGDVIRPATLVIDDCHRLDRELAAALVSVIAAHRPPALRVVLAGWEVPIAELGESERTGEAVVLTAADLAFDLDETVELLGSEAGEVGELCGAWPLALGLARSRIDRGLTAWSLAHTDAVAKQVCAQLDAELVGVLVFLARIGSWASSELEGAVPSSVAASLERFVEQQPALVIERDGRRTLQDVLREGLSALTPDGALARRVADRARLDGDVERALAAFAAGGLWEELAAELHGVLGGLLRAGRFDLVRSAAGMLPDTYRDDVTSLAVMRSTMEISKWSSAGVAPSDLASSIEALRRRCDRDDDRLVASAILVDHYRYHGDPRLAMAVVEAVPEWLNVGSPGFALDVALDRIDTLAPRVAAACADLLGAGTIVLGLSGVGGLAQRSPLAYDVGLAAARRAGEVTSFVSKNAHVQWVLGFLDPIDLVDRMVPVIGEYRRIAHPHVVNRLVERADMLLRIGRFDESYRAAAEAQDWAERTGNHFSGFAAAAVAHSASLMLDGAGSELDVQAEDLWALAVDEPLHTRWLPVYAARLASVLFDLDERARATTWIERMRATRLAGDAFDRLVGWEVTAQECRMSLRDGDTDGALDRAEALASEVRAFGLDGLERRVRGIVAAELLHVTGDRRLVDLELERGLQTAERWRIERASHAAGGMTRAECRSRLEVRSLAATLSVRWGDGEWIDLTGLPAKLLALLVADGGTSSVERCLDALWPDADPEAARNRFHGVVLRARRRLGARNDGPLQVVDGVVRLAATPDTDLVVDAWSLEAGTIDGSSDVGEFCHAQFPYDEFAVDARHRLQARWLSLTRTATDR